MVAQMRNTHGMVTPTAIATVVLSCDEDRAVGVVDGDDVEEVDRVLGVEFVMEDDDDEEVEEVVVWPDRPIATPWSSSMMPVLSAQHVGLLSQQ